MYISETVWYIKINAGKLECNTEIHKPNTHQSSNAIFSLAKCLPKKKCGAHGNEIIQYSGKSNEKAGRKNASTGSPDPSYYNIHST
jgi:hypothetical protein